MGVEPAEPRVALLCSGCGHVRRGLERFTQELQIALSAGGASTELFGSTSRRETLCRGLPCVNSRRFPQLRDTRGGLLLEQRTFAASFLAVQAVRRFDLVLVAERAVAHVLIEARRRLPALTGRFGLIYSTSAGLDAGKTLRYDFLRHATPVAFAASLEAGFPEERMRMIPHGQALRRVPPDRARFEIPGGAFVVLYSGAFVEEKRHRFLVEALARCRDRIPGLFVVFAGAGGPELPAVRDRLERLFPGAHRVGSFPPEAMPALGASCDLYVHARLGESFGNAFIEAQMQGLPVVAHPTPIHRFVLESGAILENMECSEAVAEVVVRLHGDASLRERLAADALRNAVRFDIGGVAQAFRRMFLEFAAPAPCRRA